MPGSDNFYSPQRTPATDSFRSPSSFLSLGEQYATFPAVIYEFTPNVYCADYHWQGGFPTGEFEHNKDQLVDYFASVYNSASYKPGGWYGRSSSVNDEKILVYNQGTVGLSMDVYFIGYNYLGEPGDPDYIQVDIPTELPSASPSVRPAACVPYIHEVNSEIEFSDSGQGQIYPQVLRNIPAEAVIEFGQPVHIY